MSYFDDQDAVRRRLECTATWFCRLAGFLFLSCAVVVCFLLITVDQLSSHLTMASVSNFSISNQSGTTSSITGTWLLTIAIDNNYEGGVSTYPAIHSCVSYHDNNLAQARTAPFSLGNWSSTDITIRPEASEFYIDPTVAKQMNDDWRSLGTVKFDFSVSVIGSRIDDVTEIYIYCNDTM
ncbi:hypothetical protein MLD38_004100 [Melastoma candidum]|uniref:Uncharacterized protein n=1 Tax=Melastoma candidum TaxID=119954 RepID=A0ACB9S4N6_9MYRT|nr:hypothetical protein MLD38_004100 [Melastoma candidum]